ILQLIIFLLPISRTMLWLHICRKSRSFSKSRKNFAGQWCLSQPGAARSLWKRTPSASSTTSAPVLEEPCRPNTS
ncbi:unnamed protein product, partial [Heterosigma akashiwo]